MLVCFLYLKNNCYQCPTMTAVIIANCRCANQSKLPFKWTENSLECTHEKDNHALVLGCWDSISYKKDHRPKIVQNKHYMANSSFYSKFINVIVIVDWHHHTRPSIKKDDPVWIIYQLLINISICPHFGVADADISRLTTHRCRDI